MKQQTDLSDVSAARLDSSGNPATATLWAIAIAAMLLVSLVLPAEYAIDPTGAGRVLGLTAMGERKMALAGGIGEAKAPTPPSVIPLGNSATTEHYSAISKLPLRQDEIDVKLAPNGQVEYKTVIGEGEYLVFAWDAAGKNVNFDFHGEPANGPSGAFLTYHKGTASSSGGSLKAPFTGTHGWHWKNPTNSHVVIKLRVSGFYSDIKRLQAIDVISFRTGDFHAT